MRGVVFFFFQAEDGIRDIGVTGVQTCALPISIVPIERGNGDIGLSSGWQGDSSGGTAPGPNNDYVMVPTAKNSDGSAIAGHVMARIMNAAGKDSRPMIMQSNPMPYRPASLDTKEAN